MKHRMVLQQHELSDDEELKMEWNGSIHGS